MYVHMYIVFSPGTYVCQCSIPSLLKFNTYYICRENMRALVLTIYVCTNHASALNWSCKQFVMYCM